MVERPEKLIALKMLVESGHNPELILEPPTYLNKLRNMLFPLLLGGVGVVVTTSSLINHNLEAFIVGTVIDVVSLTWAGVSKPLSNS